MVVAPLLQISKAGCRKWLLLIRGQLNQYYGISIRFPSRKSDLIIINIMFSLRHVSDTECVMTVVLLVAAKCLEEEGRAGLLLHAH